MSKVKVFISWSGEKSKVTAELLDLWLKDVLQVDTWLSCKDIDKGSFWFNEISDQLNNTCVGIICVTKSNKDKPWILFEAGALTKGITTTNGITPRVCTFLIDLLPIDIEGPLSQFNHTLPEKNELWNLVHSLNQCLAEKALAIEKLQITFDKHWPKFNKKFKAIVCSNETQKTQKYLTDVEIHNYIDVLKRIINTLIQESGINVYFLKSKIIENKIVLFQERFLICEESSRIRRKGFTYANIEDNLVICNAFRDNDVVVEELLEQNVDYGWLDGSIDENIKWVMASPVWCDGSKRFISGVLCCNSVTRMLSADEKDQLARVIECYRELLKLVPLDPEVKQFILEEVKLK